VCVEDTDIISFLAKALEVEVGITYKNTQHLNINFNALYERTFV